MKIKPGDPNYANVIGEISAMKARVAEMAGAVITQDNVDKVDLDSRPGEVLISRDAMEKNGLTPILIPDKHDTWKESVMQAQVSCDPASKEPKKVNMQCERYFDTSYGPSASDIMSYRLEVKPGKSGFLGLFGPSVNQQIYTIGKQEYWNTNNRLQKLVLNRDTGEILDYKNKEFAETFPQALKSTLLSPAGLFLNAAIVGICRCPGSLVYALLGPTGSLAFGLGAAAVFSLAVARHKMKAW